MNVKDDAFASYKLLGHALKEKGYSVAVSDDYPVEVTFTSPAGILWTTKAANMHYPFNSNEMRRKSLNKDVAYSFVEKTGFSVPYTLLIDDGISDRQLLEVLAKHKKLIVKPNDASLAKGLTINIDSLEVLKQAIKDAKQISPAVLVQQQVEGEEIRFTVFEGKVIAAMIRETAQVVGDGSATVSELIERENKARQQLQFECIGYPQLDGVLIDASWLTDNTVPAKGEVVKLGHSTMIRGGCSVYNVLDAVDMSYIRKIEAMAAELDADFFVVDVFCAAYDQPASPDNYWFIEFNTAPVLKVYYGCRDGKHFDIVDLLADAIDRYLQIDAGNDHNKQGGRES